MKNRPITYRFDCVCFRNGEPFTVKKKNKKKENSNVGQNIPLNLFSYIFILTPLFHFISLILIICKLDFFSSLFANILYQIVEITGFTMESNSASASLTIERHLLQQTVGWLLVFQAILLTTAI